ncbi:hypothetical protein DFH05DRAFT_1506115 [Lentinula detonsa]|uniref:T6SS Phospholipase effector Tle1-like catalytic domain-containing protein n=1 Tax=Lentinula detonsa TaxID=2804962 RepID=A0A9W8NV27_9AGAR|nr:hypothetical protein DFH05DRAFT_1506115 [Lentinula detonsa]
MSTPSDNKHVRNDTAASTNSVLGGQALSKTPISRESSTDSQDSTSSAASSDIVPPLNAHPYRTLVLCFDGTGDQFDSDNSNIVQLFTVLKKDDRDKQMVYYQAGIGTYTSPQIATPLMAKFSKTVDMAIGWYLDAHVMGGYEFLMQNYKADDRICIFGFSRGAYTARSLAGMIHKVGILPACNHQQVPFAYKMFTRDDEIGYAQSAAFKKAFSVDATIEFVGVWDTVNSVGLVPHRLPFTTSNTLVKTFRHALSLDERRAKFKANLWNPPSDYNHTEDVKDGGKHPHHHHRHFDLEHSRFYKDANQKTDIEEVWFAGCHCDIGGGSVSNTETVNLARVPLRWMIRECFRTNTGILFHSEGLRSLGLNPDSLWPEVKPRPDPLPVTSAHIRRIPRNPPPSEETPEASIFKTEEELDLEDALSPIYDQLSLAPGWWALEFWPVKNKFHDGSGKFVSEIGCNLGRARRIPRQKQGVKIHRSVKMRMEAQYEDGGKYVPKAKFDPKYVTWID